MDLSADRSAFPYEQQVQAKQFAEQGDYAEATALLDTLGDYAGSAALAKEYRYQQAQAEAASGNYDAAIALYTELAGYADSDALCRASRYEKAVAAQKAGDYAGAMALFADAGQYADSMARLRECCKQQGISIYYFSEDAVNAGVDTGYAKQDTISGDDKHFGWRLGRFFLTGFTRVTADENQQPVFIKTLGDSVTLWFDLEQDIDALNGNAQLSLAADANGYDQQFGIPKTNFGRGTLIVRHTDYQNAKNEPAVYTDYLLAKGTTGANTRIVLHEEGDYEVALDYEVQDSELTHITSKFGNYRIFLRFSIRNGNCMVYPFDLLTGAELQNTSVAEAGFSLDLARSRYLDINVRRAVLVERRTASSRMSASTAPRRTATATRRRASTPFRSATDTRANPQRKRFRRLAGAAGDVCAQRLLAGAPEMRGMRMKSYVRCCWRWCCWRAVRWVKAHRNSAGWGMRRCCRIWKTACTNSWCPIWTAATILWKRTGGVYLSGVSGRAGVQLAGERLLRLYAFRIKRAVSGRKVHLHPW